MEAVSVYPDVQRKQMRAIFDLAFHSAPRLPQIQEFTPFLNQYVSIRRFHKGETIIQSGEAVTTVHLIVSGKCHLFRTAQTGQSIIVDDLQPPVFQGIAPALNGIGAHLSHVVADTECLVVRFDTTFLMDCLRNDGECAMEVIIELSRSVARLRSRMDFATAYQNDDNLLYYIYKQYRLQGAPKGDFHIEAKKEAIAAGAGISLRTLYRSIHRLEEEGRIQLYYRGILVPEEHMRQIIQEFNPQGDSLPWYET